MDSENLNLKSQSTVPPTQKELLAVNVLSLSSEEGEPTDSKLPRSESINDKTNENATKSHPSSSSFLPNSTTSSSNDLHQVHTGKENFSSGLNSFMRKISSNDHKIHAQIFHETKVKPKKKKESTKTKKGGKSKTKLKESAPKSEKSAQMNDPPKSEKTFEATEGFRSEIAKKNETNAKNEKRITDREETFKNRNSNQIQVKEEKEENYVIVISEMDEVKNVGKMKNFAEEDEMKIVGKIEKEEESVPLNFLSFEDSKVKVAPLQMSSFNLPQPNHSNSRDVGSNFSSKDMEIQKKDEKATFYANKFDSTTSKMESNKVGLIDNTKNSSLTVQATTNSAQIRLIDSFSIHRICSGQVIIDLTSAIKELLENSIDAQATSIEIRVIDYGKELIEVTDNGNGISPADFSNIGSILNLRKIN